MSTMNISLPETMKAWVEQQAASGHYGNASDYVRDLIRKDTERKKAILTLQATITQGIESGSPETLDMAAFKIRMRERHIVS